MNGLRPILKALANARDGLDTILRNVQKAHVKGHVRTLEDGRTLWIADHEDPRQGRAAMLHERTAVGKHRDGTHYLRATDKEDSGDIQRAIMRLGLGAKARYRKTQANHLGQKGSYDHFHFEDASHAKAVHDELRKLKDLPEEVTPSLFEAAGLGPDGRQVADGSQAGAVETLPSRVAASEVSRIPGREAETNEQTIQRQANLVRAFVAGETPGQKSITFWVMDDAKAKEVQDLLGEETPSGSPEVLLEEGVVHSIKRHPGLTPEDWEMLPKVASDYGGSFLSTEKGKNGEKRIIFAMRHGEDQAYAYVGEVTHGRKKGDRLRVVSFFKDHINTLVSHLRDKSANPERVEVFAAGGNSSRPRLAPSYSPDPPEGNVVHPDGIGKGKVKPGDTKTENGTTYRLNENHRWERVEEKPIPDRPADQPLAPAGQEEAAPSGTSAATGTPEPEQAPPPSSEPVAQDPNTLGPGDKIQFVTNMLDFDGPQENHVIGGTVVKKASLLVGIAREPAQGYQVVDDRGRPQLILPSQVREVMERTSHIRNEGGDYEDYGDKIGGSRKDIAALKLKYDREGAGVVSLDDAEAMEQDPAFASRMITRENVLQPKQVIRDLRDNGMSPGAAFVLRRLLNAIPAKPGDSPADRKLFVVGCNRIREAFEHVKTATQAEEVVTDLLQEFHGIAILPEDMAEHGVLKAAMQRTDMDYRNTFREAKGPEFDWNEAYRAAAQEIEAKGGRMNAMTVTRRAADRASALQAEAERERQRTAEAWAKTEPALELDQARKQAKLDYQRFLARMKDKTEATPWNTAKAIKSLGAKFQETIGSTETAKTYDARHSIHQRIRNLHKDARELDKKNDWSWFKDDVEPGEKPRGIPKPQVPVWARTVPDQVERIGGSNAKHTAKTLAESFGVRGVEYGNWVNEEEAVQHTRATGDALADMADILGIDPKTISLNGRLALAFGARGNGHGMAHFEPSTKAINLTKTAGGGCLAHEWGHALDNIMAQASHSDGGGHSSYFSDGEGSKDAEPEVIEAWKTLMSTMGESKDSAGWPMTIKRGKSKYRNHAASDAILEKAGGDPSRAMAMWLASTGAEKLEKYRRLGTGSGRSHWGGDHMKAYVAKFKTEVQDQARYFLSMSNPELFDKLHFTLPKVDPDAVGPTSFLADAMQRGKYWEQPREMFARAFEAFIEDELEANGRRNTYLVTGTTSGPYPAKTERTRINDAMRNLVGVLKSTRAIQKALWRGHPSQTKCRNQD